MKFYTSNEPFNFGFGHSRNLGGLWLTVGPYTVVLEIAWS